MQASAGGDRHAGGRPVGRLHLEWPRCPSRPRWWGKWHGDGLDIESRAAASSACSSRSATATVSATSMVVGPAPAPGSRSPVLPHTAPTAAVRPGRRRVRDWAQAPRVPACAAGTAVTRRPPAVPVSMLVTPRLGEQYLNGHDVQANCRDIDALREPLDRYSSSSNSTQGSPSGVKTVV